MKQKAIKNARNKLRRNTEARRNTVRAERRARNNLRTGRAATIDPVSLARAPLRNAVTLNQQP